MPFANFAGGGSCCVVLEKVVAPTVGCCVVLEKVVAPTVNRGELLPLLCSLAVEESKEELADSRFSGLTASCTKDFFGPPSPPRMRRSAPRSSKSSTSRSLTAGGISPFLSRRGSTTTERRRHGAAKWTSGAPFGGFVPGALSRHGLHLSDEWSLENGRRTFPSLQMSRLPMPECTP